MMMMFFAFVIISIVIGLLLAHTHAALKAHEKEMADHRRLAQQIEQQAQQRFVDVLNESLHVA